MNQPITPIVPDVIGKKITIYDFEDAPIVIETPPEKVIESIYVRVLSGDETGSINFTDGTNMDFDASNCRSFDFYDGDYLVPSEKVQSWIDFEPSAHRTASYARQEKFS